MNHLLSNFFRKSSTFSRSKKTKRSSHIYIVNAIEYLTHMSGEYSCPLRDCEFTDYHRRVIDQRARSAQLNELDGDSEDDYTYRTGAAAFYQEDDDGDDDYDLGEPEIPLGCPMKAYLDEADRLSDSDPKMAVEFATAFPVVFAWALAGCQMNSEGYLQRRLGSIHERAEDALDILYTDEE